MENWKPAFGYEEHYIVSDLGRVRRIGKDRMGRCLNTMLKFGDRRGYKSVTLCVNDQKKTLAVHRLVWESFNGKIPDGFVINHKNGAKAWNRLSNLEVMTISENTAHGFRHLGRKPPNNPNPGAKNGRAIISDDQVREIRQRYKQGGVSQTSLANEFGLTQASVSRIVLRKNWSHITCDQIITHPRPLRTSQ